MFKICFSSIKGGTGKTSLAILTQSYLMNSGYKVLCIDLDIQNSMSFYFNQSENDKNIYDAMETDNLKAHIQENLFEYWIQSDLRLLEMRNTEETGKLKDLLNQIKDDYDFCIIDTSPTFDSVVQLGLNAADLIISPVHVNLFNFKSMVFLGEQLKEFGLFDKWRIIYNQYKPPVSEKSIKKEYEDLFLDAFNGSVLKSYLPTNQTVTKKLDTHSRIKNTNNIFMGVNGFIKELGIKQKKEIDFI